ncbi:bifunctional glutamate N-acetyltransferase/amino-acid acetyltransferase ArgJ [Bartonella apis]|uniref:bifunctional glutamate N-acetyltransferase/amino-acid acetyltransferase ArgJ n=1 Tax=Bartonella apis TaxID=1686310 RepID=UPI0018DCB8DB|nr:bifunctional glutamate N-acetyltransferase/amino-acid acetyltransferase ArgJ [Bartonella apis]MBI0176610.1 bifunctional glutamate N-acetyltransferase/amino-acid acetyltransferase ArgJ [Bartonella apis]
MVGKISPLAPKAYPEMPIIKGVRLDTAEAHIKYKGRTDLLFIVFDNETSVAGVFTRSKCPSAPVDHCRKILSHGVARGVVVNSGNANAFTGKKGIATTDATAKAAAEALGATPEEIYLASTGVIGEPMDASRFTDLLPEMAKNAKEDNWLEAVKAIMTTDTYPKLATRTVDFDGHPIIINGIAKGAGMIAPNMGTMLSFIVTDAPVHPEILQDILSDKVRDTFNAITVDSDTSTSDTLLLFATGTAEGNIKPLNQKNDPRYKILADGIYKILHELSLQVVADGEGAHHLIEVKVEGATTNEAARTIARSIANSPLVKTAVAGEDANWGRVVMAVGKAGMEADRDRLSIWFGPHRLAVDGERDPRYSEEEASNYMKGSHIVIKADIGLGNGCATIWSCDLTKEYVEINGDYRS